MVAGIEREIKELKKQICEKDATIAAGQLVIQELQAEKESNRIKTVSLQYEISSLKREGEEYNKAVSQTNLKYFHVV